MAFDQSGGDRPESKKFQGNWKCAKCDKEITELPFDPDPNRLSELQCRDCHRQRKSFNRDRF